MSESRRALRLMGTAELRALPTRDARRDALLAQSFSQTAVAVGSGTTRQSLKRARDAEAAGRDLHIPGRPAALHPAEDEEFVRFVTAFRNKHNKDPSVDELLQKVHEIVGRRAAAATSDESEFNSDWLRHYIARNTLLDLVPARPLEPDRVLYRDELENWFATAAPVIQQTDPALIVNMDETYLCLGKGKKKVVVVRGCALRQTGVTLIQNLGEHISLVAGVTATGEHLRSTIILPLASTPHELQQRFPSFCFKRNKKGWMTAAIFREWVHESLIPFITAKRAELGQPHARAALVVDAHNSRACSDALIELRAAGIDVLCMVGHATHVLQPLDIAVFAAFKQLLHQHCRFTAQMRAAEKRGELLRAAEIALYHAFEPNAIQHGFASAGLCPWNPAAVLNSGLPIVQGARPHQPNDTYLCHYIAGRVLTTDEVVKHVRESEEKAAAMKAKKAAAAQAPKPAAH